MISLKELNPRDLPLTDEQRRNLTALHKAVNLVRAAYGKPMIVTSGVRDVERQKQIDALANRAPRLGSAHLKAAAADFRDTDGDLKRFLLSNLPMLAELGLYMEDPAYTVTVDANGRKIAQWVHLQIVAPKSGRLIFQPYAGPPPKVLA